MKLIINAEDFGLSQSINKGICEGLKKGFISSASLFINAKYTDEAIKIIKENNFKNVGVHLNLTYGKPISNIDEIPNLVEPDGTFHYMCSMPFYAKYEEVKLELKKQIEKFYSYGLTPSHLDYHHYFYSSREVLKAYLELAKEFNLPIRSMTKKTQEQAKSQNIKTPDLFISDFHESYYSPNVEILKKIVENIKNQKGIAELMTTPGYVDEYTLTQTNYLNREQELKSLEQAFDQKVFDEVELISFNELK